MAGQKFGLLTFGNVLGHVALRSAFGQQTKSLARPVRISILHLLHTLCLSFPQGCELLAMGFYEFSYLFLLLLDYLFRILCVSKSLLKIY